VSADARHQETATRGRLRIYLGYAPGAGATCALLREGRQRAGRGADVVVARVQTHGRPHTQALLAGLDIIPGAVVPNLGAAAEMDLGTVLARRPDVTLVDELADRSLLRTGHVPRWQDVQALLAADIERHPAGTRHNPPLPAGGAAALARDHAPGTPPCQRPRRAHHHLHPDSQRRAARGK